MDARDFEARVAPHRAALRGYCYRLLGTLDEAEDAVQDTLVRAWKGLAGFEGRSSLKTWLFQIASRVCFDAIASRGRRVLPQDVHGPVAPDTVPTLDEAYRYIDPAPTGWLEADVGPDASIEKKESIALAFLVVLQSLPAQQRAVLVLREVLGLSAAETAEVLDTTVAGVNSALQRARASLDGAPPPPKRPEHGAERTLLMKYLKAWETSDVAALVATLRDDAAFAMPPMGQWFQGAQSIGQFFGAPFLFVPSVDAARFRGVLTEVAGRPGVAIYKRADPHTPGWTFDSVHVVEPAPDGQRIASVVAWLNPSLFARFGLPQTLA